MSEAFEVQTSDGICLRGERGGDGPSLVFSNSLGVTREMWRDQQEALSADYHVILYDTRGHGASDAPPGGYSIDRLTLDVIEVLNALGIEETHFCGLSLGGMTGQALAIRAPERLQSLTLAATSSYMGPPGGWQNRIDTVLSSGMEPIVDAVLQKWFAEEGGVEQKAAGTAKGWLLETNPVGYAGCCAAIRDMDLRPIVNAIDIETLILAGKNDQATPIDHATFLRSLINGAILTSMAGGHLLNLEQPTLFTNSVRHFLSELRR